MEYRHTKQNRVVLLVVVIFVLISGGWSRCFAADVEPTLRLDEEFKVGGSLVWSPASQAAWDLLRQYHGVATVALQPESPAGTYLDSFVWNSAATLPPGTLTFSGEYTGEFAAKIRESLARALGKSVAGMIEDPPPFGEQVAPVTYRIKSAIMVCALAAKPRFPGTFTPDTKPRGFLHSNGKGSHVYGFGAGAAAADRIGEDITVLKDDLSDSQVVKLALYTGDKSNAQYMVVARAPGLHSLGQGIDMIRDALAHPLPAEKVIEHRGKHWSYSNRFTAWDTFWIPEVRASLMCGFPELEGHTYLHTYKGGKLDTYWRIFQAQQFLNFAMNHKGALVEAVFKVPSDFLQVGGSSGASAPKFEAPPPPFPKHLVFDRPFLLTLWRAGAEYPYLAIWVDSNDVMRLK